MTSEDIKDKLNKTVEHLKMELSSIRTGRASISLVENIKVTAYGEEMPLNGVGSVSVPGPQLIVVSPWDKTVIPDIVKGISGANIGITPVVDGDRVRLPIPTLSEERRVQLTKLVGEKTESAKISTRTLRQDAMGAIDEMEKNGVISEDVRFKRREEVEELVKKAGADLDLLAKAKKEELLEI
ncbi:ribosome recycling factor [candidate division WWE3 bacterium CG08_land_8_20_14_0_20_41_15]|uniref:Ribosome-recycling factor n=1 Tax=candidate division WWE3 bacterium CG08_land_8_20_14_0_20_41_15 TaxID=1975086 RepID=A0A2H0XAA6_UNCKA|nr:MAG: ribosome recycling factor [candidate division WWE3 bacterium CG08_land_8_20_14_0_20_41_15]